MVESPDTPKRVARIAAGLNDLLAGSACREPDNEIFWEIARVHAILKERCKTVRTYLRRTKGNRCADEVDSDYLGKCFLPVRLPVVPGRDEIRLF